MNSGILTYLIGLINPENLIALNSINQIAIPGQALILFSLFLFIQNKCFLNSNLPKEIFQSNFILLKAFTKVKSIKYYFFLFITLLILSPFTTWSTLDSNNYIRIYSCILSVTLGLTFSTYSYNFYFKKYHFADRTILLLASIMVYFHPIFVLPTLLMSLLIIGQFFIPLYNSWTDKNLILELFILIVPFLILNGIGIPISIPAFFIVTISILGYTYFITGIGKLKMKWYKHNQLSNLIHATHHQNNWLGIINKKKFNSLLKLISSFNSTFTYGTLIIELAVIIMLIHPLATISLLICLSLFHILIFALTGIFFWKNIIILATISFLIYVFPESIQDDLFGILPLILNVLFIYILIRTNHKTPMLYWWDSPMSVKFSFEIETEDDLKYFISPSKMAPYDLTFAQGRFYNLFSSKKIVGTFGLVNEKKDLDFLNNLQNEQLKEFISHRLKINVIHKNDFNEFIIFLEKYCLYINSGKKLKLLEKFQLPQHIWTSQIGKKLDSDKKIHKLNIYVSEHLKRKEILSKKVYSLEIKN